jgi:glycosyltransferase involved in cell wall biosynthesis
MLQFHTSATHAPLISVLVPVYNVAPYLRACLDSILAQHITDFELICVDDRSTDGSLEILEEYAQKDDRIMVVRHPENKGLAQARNTLLDHANGKYIAWVDSDDLVLPHIWSRPVAIMEADDTIDLVCWGYQICTESVSDSAVRSRFTASDWKWVTKNAMEGANGLLVLKDMLPFPDNHLPEGKYTSAEMLENLR